MFFLKNFVSILTTLLLFSCSKGAETEPYPYRTLTADEKSVIIYKGTERPFTGKYNDFKGEGVYVCKQCNQPLFRSDDKFESNCGWPSFDDAIPGAVETRRDFSRTEIVCSRCNGHLGHVFTGEGFTDKNVRHCVNSISLDFIAEDVVDTAYFAGGCFWGVEYYMEKQLGVLSVTSGFMGGDVEKPSYKEVIKGKSGHVETVEVIYDPRIVRYKDLAVLFFEIHDPTQENGQGPDIGSQYLSRIFVKNEREEKIADSLIGELKKTYRTVATEVLPRKTYYAAEEYHQNYYDRKGGTPYCHKRVKRF